MTEIEDSEMKNRSCFLCTIQDCGRIFLEVEYYSFRDQILFFFRRFFDIEVWREPGKCSRDPYVTLSSCW